MWFVGNLILCIDNGSLSDRYLIILYLFHIEASLRDISESQEKVRYILKKLENCNEWQLKKAA